MKLDSVRNLKQSLTANLLSKIETTISTRAAFGRAAAPMARTEDAPSTVALGIAPRKKGDFRLAVRVQKRAFESSREVELITKQAKGEVDIRYVGRVGKLTTPWHQQRQRPLLIGCSVGHLQITAGTIGCFVQPRGGGSLCILSNNHVLANENRAKKGDAVLQPGALDGGAKPDDVVAKLLHFVRLKRPGINFVDCATAEITGDPGVNLTKLRGLGKFAGLGDAFVDEGQAVSKIGRTTGLTHGTVTAFELDNVVVRFDVGNVRFDNQIEIEGSGNKAFSDGGDSGSVIVDAAKRGVALLFAGSDQGGTNGKGLTYANPLRMVLDALKVNLAV
jgi:hypothetical protein